jgi:hypothetical protein
MKEYTSKSGKQSGVTAYEIGTDYITVQFKSKSYTYPESLNSENVINEMKNLAINSEGLSTYISRNRNNLKFI